MYKDWNYFNILPGEEDIDRNPVLPAMDNELFYELKKLAELRRPENIIFKICAITEIILDRLDSYFYSEAEAESVFIFACQIARYNGFIMEEFSKRDELLNLFYHLLSNMTASIENAPGFSDTDHVRFLIQTINNREYVIQKFCAGYYDFGFEYILTAKMLKNDRLKKYLYDALVYYETIPPDEMFEEREIYIEQIIEALGNPGWDDFIPVLNKYLYMSDDIIPFTAMDSLAIIGGPRALNCLRQFRRHILEGFSSIDEIEQVALDMNIICAEHSFRGLFEVIAKAENDLLKAQIALRMLSFYRDQEIVKFIYNLLDDERYEEMDVCYVTEDESFVKREVRFPLREEALAILENFDEDYIVSIVGEKYRVKRDYFFQDLMKLYHKKGLAQFWDDGNKWN
ncbi:MAG: hypothetical protein LWY06_02770 [Firmicutes bacterium]|nr:hypothetical protein [Bacillota bacterium]